MTVDLARLHVDWTLDTHPEAEAMRRLDALVEDLLNRALEDRLAPVDGPGLTCIQTVQVAPLTVRWTASDRELVEMWAAAIGRAVAESCGAGHRDSVVHYPNRTAVLLEVVVSLLTGDLTRRWAWDLAGVGPGATSLAAIRRRSTVASPGVPTSSPSPGTHTPDVVDAAFALAEEAPHAVPALLVTVARHGLLDDLVAALGGRGLADLLTRAGVWWPITTAARAHDRPDLSLDPAAAAAAAALARLVRSRSVVMAAAVTAGLLPQPAPTGTATDPPMSRGPEDSRPPSPGRRPHDRTANDAADPAPAPGPDNRTVLGSDPVAYVSAAAGDAALVAATLSALAVLETEPAYAGQPVGRAAVALLRSGEEPPTPAAPPHPDRRGEPGCVEDHRATDEPSRQGSDTARLEAADLERSSSTTELAPPPPPTQVPLPVASTAWGGLLFLLWLVAESDLPARVVADPARFGIGLGVSGVLHRLGAELMRRAAPDVGAPEPRDPALMAFCGLACDADPPQAPDDTIDDGWVSEETENLVQLLRLRLDDPRTRTRTGQQLLLATLRRRARVRVEPGWMDVELDLDEVRTELRRAGLDLDPGHLPWLGLVVRFRYV